jgi:hypothetical protein
MKYPYEFWRENHDRMRTAQVKKDIIKDFTSIINRYSLENDSNTPGFILAEYLYDCLLSGQLLIATRIVWYNPTNSGMLEESDE